MLPERIKKLIKAHRKVRDKINFNESLRHINVSRVVSLAGRTYENLRNTVDLEQEHLLRRRAIRRILIRLKVLRSGKPSDLAEDLLKEIIWGRYTRHDPIPEIAIEETAKIIYKYQYLVGRYNQKKNKKVSKSHAQDLYDILSFEIERVITPYYDKDMLINVQYSNLLPLKLPRSEDLPEKYESVQTYVNVIRSVNKFDDPIIRYYMFTNAFPFWEKPSKGKIENVIMNLDSTLDDIDKHISYNMKNVKYKEFIRQSIPLKILDKTISANLENAEKILNNKQTRDKYVLQVADTEYRYVKKKVRITVFKTVIYLALTKMIFALLVEVPYEKIFEGEVNYVSLGINLTVPIILMLIIAGSYKIPVAKNNVALIQMIDRLVSPNSSTFTNDGIARNRRRPYLYILFKLVTNLLSFAVVGLIAYGLWKYLHFNIVSISIFLLFLSLISFGALKTRNVATELIVIPQRGGIFTPFISTISFPILYVGKKLSEGVSKVSPIPMFLDKLIESPFKSFLMVFEEWSSFSKEQREEIV